MRKFDPWPVFFKREWNRNWPFLVGFAVTGAIITKFSLGLTGGREELPLCAEAQEMKVSLLTSFARSRDKAIELIPFPFCIVSFRISYHLDDNSSCDGIKPFEFISGANVRSRYVEAAVGLEIRKLKAAFDKVYKPYAASVMTKERE
ncbi:mitochondrial ATP synthase subunit [Striga asiatica]|uniref:Mitochondrial ATP synthase subunit n=1 Tax=Striga asiatica TaxID=4170 RepID=A0A5A7PR03_STRAF|nr:mitochondrial ATP synthase subunit [Striga asiatica]